MKSNICFCNSSYNRSVYNNFPEAMIAVSFAKFLSIHHSSFIIEFFAFYTFSPIYRSESCPNALFWEIFLWLVFLGRWVNDRARVFNTNTELDGRLNCCLLGGCLVNKINWSASCSKFMFIHVYPGNSYKFKVGTKANALRWYTYVREATKDKLDYKVCTLWSGYSSYPLLIHVTTCFVGKTGRENLM